jgi:hypothetical protein
VLSSGGRRGGYASTSCGPRPLGSSAPPALKVARGCARDDGEATERRRRADGEPTERVVLVGGEGPRGDSASARARRSDFPRESRLDGNFSKFELTPGRGPSVSREEERLSPANSSLRQLSPGSANVTTFLRP